MRYFKIIKNQNIIGIATLDNFRRYQQKHRVILYSEIEKAQYVEYNDKYYRDNWLRPLIIEDAVEYEEASIINIDEEEYGILYESLQINEEIYIEPEIIEPIEIVEPIDENEQTTFEFVRDTKISQMNNACHKKITDGIDVILSDGESHHFSLEIEDQIKIQALAMKALNGSETLFWHEDDKLCQFYSANDILAIYEGLETIQTYETTYFNSLKLYIMSLETIEEIGEIYYGIEIPVEYQSEVLQYLLSQSQQSE